MTSTKILTPFKNMDYENVSSIRTTVTSPGISANASQIKDLNNKIQVGRAHSLDYLASMNNGNNPGQEAARHHRHRAPSTSSNESASATHPSEQASHTDEEIVPFHSLASKHGSTNRLETIEESTSLEEVSHSIHPVSLHKEKSKSSHYPAVGATLNTTSPKVASSSQDILSSIKTPPAVLDSMKHSSSSKKPLTGISHVILTPLSDVPGAK
jgi:hypothetical protein